MHRVLQLALLSATIAMSVSTITTTITEFLLYYRVYSWASLQRNHSIECLVLWATHRFHRLSVIAIALSLVEVKAIEGKAVLSLYYCITVCSGVVVHNSCGHFESVFVYNHLYFDIYCADCLQRHVKLQQSVR